MNFLFSAFAIVAIIFMAVFIFLGIWIFVIILKSFRQQRYHNYILQKIYQEICKTKDKNKNSTQDYSYLIGEEDFDITNNEDIENQNISNNE